MTSKLDLKRLDILKGIAKRENGALSEARKNVNELYKQLAKADDEIARQRQSRGGEPAIKALEAKRATILANISDAEAATTPLAERADTALALPENCSRWIAQQAAMEGSV
ncbi:hypothetical protein [Devosia sp.]|uniref:hypothetical protein n=1 Tax=Devosia sp. TaxID=1871048 RepID=UPI002732C6BF|nr:hypothetical protein [Devosia sp.]MDP2779842.1 hypothetical protein [Devosia sp.]